MDSYSEIAAGIRAGLQVYCGSDESERLKDLSPNDAHDAYTYGKIAGYLARGEGEEAAWQQVKRAKEEYHTRKVEVARAQMAQARADYLHARRTLKGLAL